MGIRSPKFKLNFTVINGEFRSYSTNIIIDYWLNIRHHSKVIFKRKISIHSWSVIAGTNSQSVWNNVILIQIRKDKVRTSRPTFKQRLIKTSKIRAPLKNRYWSKQRSRRFRDCSPKLVPSPKVQKPQPTPKPQTQTNNPKLQRQKKKRGIHLGQIILVPSPNHVHLPHFNLQCLKEIYHLTG